MNKADILNYFLNNYNDIIFGKINENLNSFLENGDSIYAVNPDGTNFKLQKGVVLMKIHTG